MKVNNLKRPYLQAEEKNSYMVAKAFIQLLEGKRTFENKRSKEMWEEWSKKGMMTKTMHKNLKLSCTYLKKFCSELEENLEISERKKLARQLEKFDYKLVDDYTVQKLLRNINDNIQYAVIKRDKLIDCLEDISAVRCVGCKEDHNKCSIFKMLDDISVPYLGEEPNCPYAANLMLVSEKDKKHIRELKKKINAKKNVGAPYCKVLTKEKEGE